MQAWVYLSLSLVCRSQLLPYIRIPNGAGCNKAGFSGQSTEDNNEEWGEVTVLLASDRTRVKTLRPVMEDAPSVCRCGWMDGSCG